MSSNQPLSAKVKVKESLNTTTIMIVAGLLLFAVWLAYSQGWFGPWSSGAEVEGTKVGASQLMDLEETNAVKLSHETALPADTATK